MAKNLPITHSTILMLFIIYLSTAGSNQCVGNVDYQELLEAENGYTNPQTPVYEYVFINMF